VIAGPSFALDSEQKLLQEEIRRFAEERILPTEAARDRDRRFASEVVAELGELGLLAMLVNEEYGGPGFDPVSYVLAVEEIARASASIAVTMSVTNSVFCWPIQHYGTPEQCHEFLTPVAEQGKLGGFGLTEPSSGSDAASLRTLARRDGDDWVLDGEKAWITNAGVAHAYVVMAKTDSDAGHRGITAFVIPADCAGLSIAEGEHKMGLRSSVTASLVLDNCRIPDRYRLGEQGKGFKIALATLDHSRLGIAAQSVGIHQRALELAINYAKDRVQFGRPLMKHQEIQFKIAGIATDLAACRELTRAAASRESGRNAGRWAAQAKLLASEKANRACYEALQIHGGNGFSDEYEISRLYRDVRVTTIYEGTSEMQRLVIARSLLS